MNDVETCRAEARTSPRFAPKHHLSIFLAASESPLVHGDIKDLSECGACVRTDTTLDCGGVVTLNVRNEYSFLFRAEAQIVWRSAASEPREAFDCAHGILFTELSPFTRKLIRRLGGKRVRREGSSLSHVIEKPLLDADSDPDLEILFRAERSLAEVDADRLDLLSGPPVRSSFPDGRMLIESAKVLPDSDSVRERSGPSGDAVDTTVAPAAALSKLAAIDSERPLTGSVELSGNLGYFDNADVLQMLEATRATGVLYVEGPCRGEIQLLHGKIRRCFSEGLTEQEAAYRLVIARQGRFHFIPCHVPVSQNAPRARTTTELLLEAQLHRDRNR